MMKECEYINHVTPLKPFKILYFVASHLNQLLNTNNGIQQAPGTNIDVSKICLGTMTWGRQNSDSEAYEQMDYSLDHGVNFFDTAELYQFLQLQTDTQTRAYNW